MGFQFCWPDGYSVAFERFGQMRTNLPMKYPAETHKSDIAASLI